MSDPPIEGVTPSDIDRGAWCFRCECEGCPSGYCEGLPAAPCARRQHYAPAEEPGGVTRSEAEWLGWRLSDKGWLCPGCAEGAGIT